MKYLSMILQNTAKIIPAFSWFNIRMESPEACKNGNFEDTRQSGEKRLGGKLEADGMFSLFSKK